MWRKLPDKVKEIILSEAIEALFSIIASIIGGLALAYILFRLGLKP